MIRVHRATVAGVHRSEHAEGPLWDAAESSLMWIDQYRGLVLRAKVQDGVLSEPSISVVPPPVGAIVHDADGGWVVAAGRGFHRLAADGRVAPIRDVLGTAGPRMRMNDGKVDPLGRFWAGSMAYEKVPGAGTLYRLERGEVAEVLRGATISNGLAWNERGDLLWYIDTPTQRVERFRVRRDSVDHDGTAVVVPDSDGHPDGMTIDDEGCLWVALWDGSAVQRYAPSGEVLERVEVGARQVSSCCFGGDDLRTLFITTSAEGYGDRELQQDPDAGAIFAVRVDVGGRAPVAYQS